MKMGKKRTPHMTHDDYHMEMTDIMDEQLIATIRN